MKHALDLKVASEFGVDIALLLENFQFWTLSNLANKRNLYDGLCWTYNTLEAFVDIFPYWTKRQIERVINSAVDANLIQKGNYNHTKYDRTIWYALTPKSYAYFPELLKEKYLESLYLSISPNGEMDFTEWRNRFPQNVTPIPDTKPVTKPNTKKKIYKEKVCVLPEVEIFDCSKNGKDDYAKSDKSDNQHFTQVADNKGADNIEDFTKSDYHNNQSKNKSIFYKNNQYVLDYIQESNIFQIPWQMILDWNQTRIKKKSPITQTAWNKINKELTKCVEQGIDAIDAFETMVASGWQSMKLEWLINQNSFKKESSGDVFSRAMNKYKKLSGAIYDQHGYAADPFFG